MKRAKPQRGVRRRGASLIDGLIALAILSFGLLGMTRLQSRLVTSATDAQARQTATELAAELVATAVVDAANAACYTRPQAGTCGNSAAVTRTTDWATRAAAALPGGGSSTSSYDSATGRLTVTLTWTGRENSESRAYQVITDVRP